MRRAADGVLAGDDAGWREMTALREASCRLMVRVNDAGDMLRRPARWDDLPARSHACSNA